MTVIGTQQWFGMCVYICVHVVDHLGISLNIWAGHCKGKVMYMVSLILIQGF